MKKKIFSLCLSLSMLLSAVPSVTAAHISDVANNTVLALAGQYTAERGYGYNTEKGEFNVDVKADVKVRKSGSGSYGDYSSSSPLEVRQSSLTSSNYPEFDWQATVDMSNVRKAFESYWNAASALAGNDNTLKKELESSYVKGHFTIEVTYPDKLIIPSGFINGTNMYGFTTESVETGVYTEVSRTVSSTSAKIEIDALVKGKDLKEDSSKLRDLVLECKGIKATVFGESLAAGGKIGISVSGESFANVVNYEEGYTDIYVTPYNETTGEPSGDPDVLITRIIYKSNYDEAAVKVTKTSSGGGGGGGGGSFTPSIPSGGGKATIRYNIPFSVVAPETMSSAFDKRASELPNPTDGLLTELPEGVIFGGWFYDPAFTRPVSADDILNISGDVTLYGKWVNVKVPDDLTNTGDEAVHYAYVIGYPEGDVRPEQNITRDEVTTIFYRLLNAQVRDGIFTSDNSFTDVPKSLWSCKAVSTMANGGYVQGYADGSFKPEAPITRAEFVTMAARFAKWDSNPTIASFADTSGHWAETYIKQGVVLGWVAGYEDGTFKPDQYITRAEAMAIFNRVLNRHVNAEGLLAEAVYWPDNAADAWYYYEVEEATNSHNYTRQADQYNETWSAIIENKIWTDKSNYEDPDQ